MEESEESSDEGEEDDDDEDEGRGTIIQSTQYLFKVGHENHLLT